MNNKIVIEIPSIKKEVLRVAAYCRVSTAYEEQQTSCVLRSDKTTNTAK